MAHALFVLVNGSPSEWALVRNLEQGEFADDAEVSVFRFDGLSDELVARVEAEGPKAVWEELRALPHDSM